MGRKVGHTADVLMARSLLLLVLWGLGSSLCARADLPQPRAPRLLRLLGEDGKALQGDCFAPQFTADAQGLFFLRSERSGGRSLWMASPLVRPGERYPAWRATPLLRNIPQFQLSEAVAVRGDKKLLFAVGASEGQPFATQLKRIETGKTVKVRPLWSGRERMAHLALSPDGDTLVFTRYVLDAQKRETPQLWRIDSDGRDPQPTLVAARARRALWLDGTTLVFERLVGRATAFYAVNPFNSEPPRLLLRGSGEGASIGKGAGVIFSAISAVARETSLFVLSRDGSGLRSLVDTLGARRPAVSLDSSRLAYDAPYPKNGPRLLWVATLAPPQSASFDPAGWRISSPMKRKGVVCQNRLEPMPLPPPAPPNPVPVPVPAPRPTALPTPLPVPTAAPEPVPTSTPAPPSPNADKADVDVAGTLASVGTSGKMPVVFWAKNRGTRTWTPADVRVVVRWIDFDTGTRRRWEYKWLKATIPPLGQFRLPMDVTVPPKAGRYKLVYSLIRLPAKGAPIMPPPYNASQDDWPGEFAATAFAVNVK